MKDDGGAYAEALPADVYRCLREALEAAFAGDGTTLRDALRSWFEWTVAETETATEQRRWVDTEGAMAILSDFYADEPFVVTDERSPSTKATLGSNAAHLTARVDPRTGLLLAICAIDNLVKGASGQAVQCANAVLGLDETTGLTSIGVYP